MANSTGNSGAGAATSENLGNGGNAGGGGNTSRAGGSGIVILSFPSSYNITVGSGLTSSETTSGDKKIVSFTAGEDTVSIG